MSVSVWRRYAYAAMSSLMAIVVGGVALAYEDPLTLAEAQRLAAVQSEKLAASRFAQTAASELTAAAGELADPVLRMGFDNVPINGPDSFELNRDFMTMTRVGVMQEWTRGSKRRLRTERAELAVSMAEAEREMTLATVQRETALAWFQSYYTQRQFDLMREQAVAAQSGQVAAESAYAQGRSTSADVLAARELTGQVQDQVAEMGSRMRAARIVLSRWIGDDAQRPLTIRPNIDELPLHAHRDIEQLEAQLREHPDIVLLDRQLQMAQTEADLAREERRSDWSIELMYGRRRPAFDDMISLGVSIPLQLNRRDRQDRELASRLAMASSAKQRRDDMYRQHVAEVRAMLDGWNTARDRLARYRRELLPLASDRIAAAEAGYRGGTMSLADVIAARRNLIDAQLQATAIEAEIAQLWAELSFLGATNQAAQENPSSGVTP